MEPVSVASSRQTTLFQSLWPPLTAIILGLSAAVFVSHGQVYLGFDQFYYVESVRAAMAGDFMCMHTSWAPGFPLLGAFMALSSVSVATALMLVSAVGFMVAILMLDRGLMQIELRSMQRCVFLCAFAVLPAETFLLATPLSESVFTGTLMWMLVALHGWRMRGAVWPLAAAVMLVVGVRYAGIPIVIVLMFLAADQGVPIQRRRRLLIPFAFAAATIAAMVLWNSHVSGDPTGEARIAANLDFIQHASDLGWAAVSVFTSGGASIGARAGQTVIGLIVLCLIIALNTVSLRTRRGGMSADASLLCLAYIIGLIVLRSAAGFDRLSHPRFIIPAVPLMVIAMLGLIDSRKRALRTIAPSFALACILIGGVQAWRHHQTADPMLQITEAERLLRPLAGEGTVIAVPYEAKSILRGTDATVRFGWKHKGLDGVIDGADFVVLVAGWHGSEGYRYDEPWRTIVQSDSLPGAPFHIRTRGEYCAIFQRDAQP